MSNTRTILLVRTLLNPNDATKVSFRWAESVKQDFEAKGWQVLDLAINNALRAKVEEALRGSESTIFRNTAKLALGPPPQPPLPILGEGEILKHYIRKRFVLHLLPPL